MQTQSPLGPDEHLAHIIGDIANAVSERAGEPLERRRLRAEAAALTIGAFAPRDVIEVMIAGHCVLFHELIVDAVPDALRGETEVTRRTAQRGLVAMDRAFGNNLTRLERYRKRVAEEAGELEDARAVAATAGRARRDPVPEAIDVDAAATVRLDGADVDPMTEAGGPGEDWEAAVAAKMAGLNRQARRELSRQARKRLGSAMARIGKAGGAANRNGSAPKTSGTAAG
jgi:hypothetical protein